MELQAVHGETGSNNSCAKCHPSPRNTVVNRAGGCVSGDCHKINTSLAMHGSLDASHTTPVSAQTNCSGSTCHGTVSGNVAEIHKNYGGCPDCHGAGKTPSLVCSTCHAAHGDLTTVHTATMTSASFTISGASVGTVTCVTCHPSADLRAVHASAGACAACHPGIKTALGGTTTWTGSCTQGTCHGAGSAHPYHATQNNHTVSNSCISADCHPNGNVAVIHNATASKCAACHATGKPALTLVCGTTGCHPAITSAATHPKYGNHTVAATGCSVAGCHQTNMTTVHGRTGCPACHAAGKPNLTGATCATCHGGSGVGTTVTSVASHTAVHDECNSCHSSMSWHSDRYPPSDTVGALGWACSDCHNGTVGTAAADLSGVDWDTLHSGDSGCSVYECHY